MPQVSIVLPAYNSAPFIRETIGSVVAQTFGDWELLVIDDGSTDGTADLVRGVDPRVVVIQQVNAGIARARNTGISHALGHYIAFIDHDDYWHPQKLEVQLAAFARHPECRLVYGEFLAWDPTAPMQWPSLELDPEVIDQRLSGWIYHELLKTNWVLFSTALVAKEVFQRIGTFDPALPPADDWHLAIRASRHFQFLKLAQPVALYRQHRGQTSRRVDPKDHETELRGWAIREYGLRGPDGREVDATELRAREFRSHFRHGTLHFANGDPRIAIRSLRRALSFRPTSAKAWLYYVASLGKCLIRPPSPR